MKRLSFLFFFVALLLAGVAIAAVVARANGFLPDESRITTVQGIDTRG